MVNYFYLKAVAGDTNLKVGYASIKMEQEQQMIVIGVDFRDYGIGIRDLDFFPDGSVVCWCRISELAEDVFAEVLEVLESYHWDFSLCSDPYCVAVQLNPKRYKPKNNKSNGANGF